MNATQKAMNAVRNAPKPKPPPCPHCNATARAMEYVRNQWIAAGIDRE